VPVKPNTLPEPHVTSSSISAKSDRFTLPKKLICMNTSGSYKVETHQVTPMVLRAEQVCTYDLDNVDQHWLFGLNGERARTGQSNLTETEMERSVEELERQCWDKINSTLRNSDDMETAQDDSIICDVCRSVSQSVRGHPIFGSMSHFQRVQAALVDGVFWPKRYAYFIDVVQFSSQLGSPNIANFWSATQRTSH
jgi:hypothetical protein